MTIKASSLQPFAPDVLSESGATSLLPPIALQRFIEDTRAHNEL